MLLGLAAAEGLLLLRVLYVLLDAVFSILLGVLAAAKLRFRALLVVVVVLVDSDLREALVEPEKLAFLA